MNEIRRAYVYLVCFISLQMLISAINGMVGGFARQALLSDSDGLSFLIFQIAIVVVSGPIFMGHWLWAEYAARKQADERASVQRRLYLYLTLSMFMLYVVVAAFNGFQSLFSLIFPPDFGLTSNNYIATIINSVVTVIATGILWMYHRVVTLTDERATVEPSQNNLGLFKHLYRLAFSALGAVLVSIGLFGMIYILLNIPDEETRDLWPNFLPLLFIGAALFAPFQFFTLVDPQSSQGWRNTLRWLYALVFSFSALALTVFGLYALQIWVFYQINGRTENPLPWALAALFTGLPVLIYHEVLLQRSSDAGLKTGRWLYGLLVSSIGLGLAVIGSIAWWQWLFNTLAGERSQIPEAAASLLAGLLVWGYHYIAILRRGGDIGVLRRLYYFGFSGLGLCLTAIGLIGVQEWLYTRFAGESVTHLPDALALLITGLPVWLRFWAWAQSRFAGSDEEERKSDLRKAYLYLVIFTAVSSAVITAALLVNGILRALLQLPTEGGLGLPLAIIIASGALWAYHAFVLRSDIAKAGESKLQAGMQRLYWYVVAGVGLAALALGLAGDLSVLVRALGTFSFPADLREQFAGFTATWLAGLPVWLIGWVPAQRLATRDDAGGVDARRSLLRKAYIYLYWLAAILTLLISAIAVVYLLLSAVFGLLASENILQTLTNLGQAVGFAVIALAVWIYHLVLLRRDNAFARREQESVLQQTAAQWETLRVVVVVVSDSPINAQFLESLSRELPQLKPVSLELPPASEPMPEEMAAQLTAAQIIITSMALALPGGPLAAYPALKLVVLPQLTGTKWIGGETPAVQAAVAIRQAAQTIKRESGA